MADTDFEQLVENLSNFPSLKISVSELRKLSTDTVVSIYVEILKHLEIDVRNLKNPLNTETQYHLSYYDPDFRFIMKLYSVINQILQKCFYIEFDLLDLLMPGIACTASVGTVLCNFLSFKYAKKESVNAVVQQASERSEKFKKMAACKEKLRDEINFQLKHKAELTMQCSKLEKDRADLEGSLFELLEEKHNHDFQNVNKKLADYDHKISKLESEGNKLAESIEELKQQIVSSPEQLVQNLEALKVKEQQLKEEETIVVEQMHQRKIRSEELGNCAHTANAVREETRNTNKLIDEIRNVGMTVERSEMEKTNVEHEMAVKNEETGWIKKVEVENQQKINDIKEHLADKKEKAQMKIREIKEKAVQCVNSIEETTRIKKEHIKELQEYKSKINTEQTRDDDVLLNIEQESQEIIQEVKTLSHMYIHFHQRFLELENSEES